MATAEVSSVGFGSGGDVGGGSGGGSTFDDILKGMEDDNKGKTRRGRSSEVVLLIEERGEGVFYLG